MATTARYYATSTYFPNPGTKLAYVNSGNALGSTSGNIAVGFSFKNGNPYEIGFKFTVPAISPRVNILKIQCGIRSAMANKQAGIDYFTYDSFLGSINKPDTNLANTFSQEWNVNMAINEQWITDNAYILISGNPNTVADYGNSIDYAYIDITYELTSPTSIYRGDTLVNMTRRNDLGCSVRRGDYLLL